MRKRTAFFALLSGAIALTGCAAFPTQMATEQSKSDALESYALRDLKDDIAEKGVPSPEFIRSEDARLETEFWEGYADDRKKVASKEMSERDFFMKAKDSWDNTRVGEVDRLNVRRSSVLNELELRAKTRDVGGTAWEEAGKKAASAKLDLTDLQK